MTVEKLQKEVGKGRFQLRSALEVGLNPLSGVGGTPSIQIESYGYNVNIISI
jgi:hypothetical protein